MWESLYNLNDGNHAIVQLETLLPIGRKVTKWWDASGMFLLNDQKILKKVLTFKKLFVYLHC